MEGPKPASRSRAAPSELQALLSRLASGDRSAFHPLFQSLWPLLQRFARRLVANEADGDDAAQQALLKIFARAREYDPSRQALPWVLAIAHNECRTLRKQRLRRREVGSEPAAQLTAPHLSPEHALMTRELEAALSAAFSDLRPEDVHTLALSVAEDRGERPEVPAATFRKRVERALERLRLAWRAKHGAPL
jgi:RNA polymerase sigma factor (sigma-70 family)